MFPAAYLATAAASSLVTYGLTTWTYSSDPSTNNENNRDENKSSTADQEHQNFNADNSQHYTITQIMVRRDENYDDLLQQIREMKVKLKPVQNQERNIDEHDQMMENIRNNVQLKPVDRKHETLRIETPWENLLENIRNTPKLKHIEFNEENKEKKESLNEIQKQITSRRPGLENSLYEFNSEHSDSDEFDESEYSHEFEEFDDSDSDELEELEYPNKLEESEEPEHLIENLDDIFEDEFVKKLYQELISTGEIKEPTVPIYNDDEMTQIFNELFEELEQIERQKIYSSEHPEDDSEDDSSCFLEDDLELSQSWTISMEESDTLNLDLSSSEISSEQLNMYQKLTVELSEDLNRIYDEIKKQ